MWLQGALYFGFFIQVSCPVYQVKGSEEQREGYSGDPVDLAHAVEGLLGLGGFGFWLFLGLGWRRGGTFSNSCQTRVSGNVRSKRRRRRSGVGVVLFQQ